jgi:DHA1 family multidrug resistance protein-like MFS transporter
MAMLHGAEPNVNLVEKFRKEFPFFRGNYMILIISWIMMDFAGELPGTYYPDYVIQLGGSATIIGLIVFASLVALASVQFLGGFLADKYGRRWLVSTFTFGLAVGYLFYAVAPSWQFILAGAIIQNLCLVYQPALNAMMMDSLPPEKRGMGFSFLNLIMSVSTTPAPAVALLLVATYGSITGMRVAYIIVTLLFLAAAMVRLKLQESMKNPEKRNLKEAFHSYPTALKEGINVWKSLPRSTLFLFFSEMIMRTLVAMTQMLFLVYAFYVLQIGGTPLPELYTPQIDPALQAARVRWGYVMIVLFLVMITASYPVGKVLDRHGRKIPLIASGLLMIPAALLFVYGNYITMYITMPLVGISMLLGFSSYQTLFTDLVPQALRGKATGSMNFFTYIAMAIGGVIGGILYDTISPQLPFLLMAVLATPAVILVVFYVHEPKPEDRQA